MSIEMVIFLTLLVAVCFTAHVGSAILEAIQSAKKDIIATIREEREEP